MLKYPAFDWHLLNALALARVARNYFPARQHACSEWLNTTHLSEEDLAAAIAHMEILVKLTEISQYTAPASESRIYYLPMNGLFDRFATDTAISSARVGIFCRSAREILAWIKRHAATQKQAHAVLDSLLSDRYTDEQTASVLERRTSSFGKSPPNIKALTRALARDSDYRSTMTYPLMKLMR
jgi:hypothetical protein